MKQFTKDVKGDGNCLFRCIALAFQGTQNTHQDYRNLCAETLNKEKVLFEDKIHQGMLLKYDENRSIIDQYIEQIQTNHNMAGLIELQVLSLALNVKFVIEGIGQKELEIGLTKFPKKEIGLLRIKNSKHPEGHYNLKYIKKIKNKEEKNKIQMKVNKIENKNISIITKSPKTFE